MAKAEKKKKVMFIRTAFINDLVRRSCRFEQTPTELLRTTIKGESRIMSLGESVDSYTFIYYAPSNFKGNIIRYVAGKEERVEFTEDMNLSQADTYYMNIIDVELSKFISDEPVKIKNMVLIRIGTVEQLVKAVIKKAIENERMEEVYSFSYKGKVVLGAFDLFEELNDDQKIFYYALMDSMPKEGFIRYDYSNNKVDFSNEIGEHSYMYVKKIELAEPFPFFSLE